ncbi:MAG: aminodeoxychorismate/anthranilate synthase component II [Bacteroidota bacterium]
MKTAPTNSKNKRILLIDNYDSFTYNLWDYFLQLDTDCQVVRNDAWPLEQYLQTDFDALVLSPGPKTPAEAGHLMSLIQYFHQRKPILGICLGHQGIGEFFGAQLTKASLPVHGKTSTLLCEDHPLFHQLPKHFEVMRYHSLLLKQLDQTPLQAIAHTPEGEIMALAHRQLPIYGFQFHPESILTQYGLELLRNWLRLLDD